MNAEQIKSEILQNESEIHYLSKVLHTVNSDVQKYENLHMPLFRTMKKMQTDLKNQIEQVQSDNELHRDMIDQEIEV